VKRIAILTLFVASHALAHHGWSEYDAGQPLQLAGTIEASGYSHPHGFVQLKTDSKTWTVVLAPPTRMENRGLTQQMLAVGQQAVIHGYPNRNKPEELRAERITVDGKAVELR